MFKLQALLKPDKPCALPASSISRTYIDRGIMTSLRINSHCLADILPPLCFQRINNPHELKNILKTLFEEHNFSDFDGSGILQKKMTSTALVTNVLPENDDPSVIYLSVNEPLGPMKPLLRH
jgi:hypothetical protein